MTERGDVGEHGRVADNVERPSSNFFISVAEKKKQDTAAIGDLTPESKPRKTPQQLF